MKTEFVVNDYMLIWNLLFGASISEKIHQLKQKIWDTYKIQYNAIFKDKEIIMKDYKNFIPNDDTVYNIVLENENYEKIKKQSEQYRVEIMRIWDKNKKHTDYLFKNMIRKDISNYTMFVVNQELNVLECSMYDSMIIGKKIDLKDSVQILCDMTMSMILKNMKTYDGDEEKFKKAILEFAVINEYATRINGWGCYDNGDISLKILKKWLYPYWLMYLGIPKEEFSNYMKRDNIFFDADKYAYEKQLKKMNIEEFIEFCFRNQRYIIREEKKKAEEIEIL